MNYKTPQVYVEEKSILPPSVAEVSTAIPAFIGYTERALKYNTATRISSFLDYQRIFGGAPVTYFTVEVEVKNNSVKEVEFKNKEEFKDKEWFTYRMYDCLRLYFANGGGDCYIVSVGNYMSPISITQDALKEGINVLEKEDEPTLIVMADGTSLSDEGHGSLCQHVLEHCAKLKDRFAIFDAGKDRINQVSEFREKLGINNLKYGAAYFPYLITNFGYYYTDDSVEVTGIATASHLTSDHGLLVTYIGNQADAPKIKIVKTSTDEIKFKIDNNHTLTIDVTTTGKSASEVITAWEKETEKKSFKLQKNGSGENDIQEILTDQALTFPGSSTSSSAVRLSDLKNSQTGLYNQIKIALDNKRLTLPPSAAIAGVYARVDRERGVWKSPANVSLAEVIGPTVKITDKEQEHLNVDAMAGKSINAIRSFTGKGTVVWGARTLAGNDNEWRYISVRRLFNLIEESLQKSTAFAVFEPNNAMTWLKVRAMMQSYLDDLWRKGALVGSTPEEAYFVKAGLGETMTEQDILEGRLIVEVGVAAVRPAEFVILRFSHKLQSA